MARKANERTGGRASDSRGRPQKGARDAESQRTKNERESKMNGIATRDEPREWKYRCQCAADCRKSRGEKGREREKKRRDPPEKFRARRKYPRRGILLIKRQNALGGCCRFVGGIRLWGCVRERTYICEAVMRCSRNWFFTMTINLRSLFLFVRVKSLQLELLWFGVFVSLLLD